jgi:hypothetical protein
MVCPVVCSSSAHLAVLASLGHCFPYPCGLPSERGRWQLLERCHPRAFHEIIVRFDVLQFRLQRAGTASAWRHTCTCSKLSVPGIQMPPQRWYQTGCQCCIVRVRSPREPHSGLLANWEQRAPWEVLHREQWHFPPGCAAHMHIGDGNHYLALYVNRVQGRARHVCTYVSIRQRKDYILEAPVQPLAAAHRVRRKVCSCVLRASSVLEWIVAFSSRVFRISVRDAARRAS